MHLCLVRKDFLLAVDSDSVKGKAKPATLPNLREGLMKVGLRTLCNDLVSICSAELSCQ